MIKSISAKDVVKQKLEIFQEMKGKKNLKA